jgi:hypothetical protein
MLEPTYTYSPTEEADEPLDEAATASLSVNEVRSIQYSFNSRFLLQSWFAESIVR